ncbi:MAG: hypothetical protein HRT68_16830 [Flavobacteriaceae bacterium]|nr:hypothetical protein [Flavobacteriaceae bacterium]
MLTRKFIALFLAFFYLTVNSGLAFNIHYCGGQLESISSFISEIGCEDEHKKPCCAEKKQKKSQEEDGCCSDETIDLEASDDLVMLNNSGADFLVTNIPDQTLAFQFYFEEEIVTNDIAKLSYQSNAPPLYKLYCQYTFYS